MAISKGERKEKNERIKQVLKEQKHSNNFGSYSLLNNIVCRL